MVDVQSELRRIADLPAGDAKGKEAEYIKLVDVLVEKKLADQLRAFLDAVIDDAVPVVVSRPVLTRYATKLEELDNEPLRDLATYAIAKVGPRVVSFEEADALLRRLLADVHIAEGEWGEGAALLGGIDVESSQRYSPAEKADLYVKVSQLWLKEGDELKAETFITRASQYCHGDDVPWQTRMRYQVSYAQILDSKRKFQQAAVRYYSLSQVRKRGAGGQARGGGG